ncbi:MAG TPA: energy transducer TonB [Gemmatimonadaceae bacterium]|jgi:TonB family protein
MFARALLGCVIALGLVAPSGRAQTFVSVGVIAADSGFAAGVDSIVVSASEVGLASVVAYGARGPFGVYAMAVNLRRWTKDGDSLAPLRTVRGGLSVVSHSSASSGDANVVLSLNGQDRPPVQFRLTEARFSQLMQSLSRAADVTDSLTAITLRHGPMRKTPVTPGRPGQTYFEYQVEKQAVADPHNSQPAYPDSLRARRIEGEVLAQFVVDTMGHVDVSTFKVLRTTNALFSASLFESLPDMLFSPAEVGGRKVRQLVQMPFVFHVQ